ncbi:MAG: S-layer homology domain-containing protein [Bacillota bacterium]
MPKNEKIKKSVSIILCLLFILTQLFIGYVPPAFAAVLSVDPTDDAVTMASGNYNVSGDNKFVLTISNATVSGTVYEGDLIITGLPSGLTATAVKGTGNDIEITVSGTASSPVNSTINVDIVVKASAVTEGGMTDSTPAIVKVNPSDGGTQIAVNPVDAAVTMDPGNTAVSGDNKFVLTISNATVSGTVYEGDLIITGLPSGLTATAVKGTGNDIEIIVSGTASSPVNSTINVDIVVKASAVTEGGMTDSTPAIVQVNPSGGGGGPQVVWRYDTDTQPTDPGMYHPFDFNNQDLVLYWKEFMDGGFAVPKYRIYRAQDAMLDWSNPANWTVVSTVYAPFTTVTVPDNGINFISYSDPELLSGTNPGTMYRYGIEALDASETPVSGISNIPYPVRAPGALGIHWFALIPEAFAQGKYGLAVLFSGPVDVTKATALGNYAVTIDGSPVSLTGPDGGQAVYNGMENAVIMATDITINPDPASDTRLVRITASNITGPGNEPMNTDPVKGPHHIMEGPVRDYIFIHGGGGDVMPVNPIGGQTSEYVFHFNAKEAVSSGGQIKITFPSDYTIDNTVAMANTSGRPFDPNGDINGPASGTPTISNVSVNTGTREIVLTVSGNISAGDGVVFVLSNITNPTPPSPPGQAYQFTVKAPDTSSNSITLPGFVKYPGSGNVTVNLKDEATQNVITNASATVNIGGPGLPPEGLSKSITAAPGVPLTFTFNGLQADAGYHVWISNSPADYMAQVRDLPVWIPSSGNAPDADFYMTNLNAADLRTVTVTVNNLPNDAKAVVFAGGQNFYYETSNSSPATGSTREYQLKVRVPGQYMLGIYPYMPPPAPGMITTPAPPEFMPPLPKPYDVTGNMSATINLTSQADLASVTVELKDGGGNVPSDGGVFAYSPTSPDVGGTGGRIGSDGTVVLKLKKDVAYIVGGGAPGMPPAPEKKVLFAGSSGTLYVDGLPAVKVSLMVSKPNKKITGYIKYSDGNAVPGVPVHAMNTSAPGQSPPSFTDSNGNYTLWVPSGVWNVMTFIPELGPQKVAENVNTSSSDAVIANLNLPPLNNFATVTGTVTEGGNPLPGAMVWAEGSDKGFLGGTVTDSSGNYTLKIDSSKTAGAKIRCAVPGYGEMAPVSYDTTVNFTITLSTLTINFGRPVNGFAGVRQPPPGFHNGKELKGVSSVTIKAPAGTYTVDIFVQDIGHIVRDNVAAPGVLDLTGDVAVDNTVNLNVTVNGGGDDTWVNLMGIEGGKAVAAGMKTTAGAASFKVPKNTQVSVSVHKEGYFPAKQDVTVGDSDASATFNLTSVNTGTLVTVNLTGSGASANRPEYLVWAKNVSTGSVVKTRSASATGIGIKLPSTGTWVFKASTDGYYSSEQTVSITGTDTVTISLSNEAQTKTSTTVVKPSQGGAISSSETGVNLVIPANALGSDSTNASVTAATTTAVAETATAKPMGTAKEINITDSEGNSITSLNQPVEISLDYSTDYQGWVTQYGQDTADTMADNMQLAYWDTAVDDWVVIAATNDTTSHIMRGYTDHFTKFAVVYPQSLSLSTSQNAGNNDGGSGGGGGGGGGGGSVTGNTGGATSGLVSEGELNSALGNASTAGKVVLKADPTIGKVVFTSEQINKIESTGKPLELASSEITFNLASSALKVDGFDTGKVTNISLGAQKASQSIISDIAANAKNGGLYIITGNIYKLEARATMSDQTDRYIEKFNGMVRVSLPVPESYRNLASNGTLLVCRYNEETGIWDEVKGSYDASKGVYVFETDKFSYWALMIKKSVSVEFSDISGHWAREIIQYMAVNGYVSGMGGGVFAPEAPVTRAQFATMLVNVLKLTENPMVPFGDVDPGEWYYNSVGRAYAAGLVKGVGPDLFAPDRMITREQMAAMICNALRYKGILAEVDDVEGLIGGFADRPSISDWARKHAAQAVKQGILKGKPFGNLIKFAPLDKATRAEAAVMLKNLVFQVSQ